MASKHITIQPSSDGGIEAVARLNGVTVSAHMTVEGSLDVSLSGHGFEERESMSQEDAVIARSNIRVDEERGRRGKGRG